MTGGGRSVHRPVAGSAAGRLLAAVGFVAGHARRVLAGGRRLCRVASATLVSSPFGMVGEPSVAATAIGVALGASDEAGLLCMAASAQVGRLPTLDEIMGRVTGRAGEPPVAMAAVGMRRGVTALTRRHDASLSPRPRVGLVTRHARSQRSPRHRMIPALRLMTPRASIMGRLLDVVLVVAARASAMGRHA